MQDSHVKCKTSKISVKVYPNDLFPKFHQTIMTFLRLRIKPSLSPFGVLQISTGLHGVLYSTLFRFTSAEHVTGNRAHQKSHFHEPY